MESIYLKTLVAIVKLGDLSKAADALCVSQPAVSKRIKFMEEQYGCALLERVGNTLHPTEAGRLVMEKAEILSFLDFLLLLTFASKSLSSRPDCRSGSTCT